MFTDEFGELYTDHSMMEGTFSGSFENSATSGSDLTVHIFKPRNPEVFGFRLLEYNTKYAYFTNSDVILLSMKIDDDVYTVELNGTPPTGDLTFYSFNRRKNYRLDNFIDDNEIVFEKFIEALRAEKTIPCYIIIGSEDEQLDQMLASTGGSKYNFKIDGKGFAKVEDTIG